eukprot:531011-Karenia_brevis.AAC.1
MSSRVQWKERTIYLLEGSNSGLGPLFGEGVHRGSTPKVTQGAVAPLPFGATAAPKSLRGPEGQEEPSGGDTCNPGRDPSRGLT